jgi:hypothetical protein
MITLIFYILGGMIGFFASWLPTFSVWPDSLITGIDYFGEKIMLLNFIFPIYELSFLILFLILFFSTYYTARIIAMVLNWIRGSGSIEL